MSETNDSMDVAALEEAMQDLQEMTELSAEIVTAKRGDTKSLEAIRERDSVKGEFPGNRQRAMGHALVIIEDLEELGVPASREYVEETEFGHRIDIHIGGGDTSDE